MTCTTALKTGTRALAAAALIATPNASAADLTAITNVSVIDVIRGEAMPGRTVLIEGNTIAAVVPADAFKPAKEATLIDGTGKFLMPGLFDAHVHYVDPDSFGPMFVANGVLFVRDMGGVTEQITALRDQLNRAQVLGPEMICTGNIIDGDPPVWPFSEPCDTPEEGRAAVRKLHAAGVNQIKVYSRLKKDVYQAAVAEAKAVGLKAVGHIPNECTLDDAIAAGQASLEHMMMVELILRDLAPPAKDAGEDRSRGLWPSARFWAFYPDVDKAALARQLRKLAESEMLQCPTLAVTAGIGSIPGGKAGDDPRMAYVPNTLRSFWGGEQYEGLGQFMQWALPHMKSMVGDLYRAGVPLMVGTDLANPYVFAGFSVHDELKLFVEAGVSPADALRAATIIPARFCGVGDRLGTIEPDKAASIVMLTANPLDDITNTTKIDSVWLRGKRYDRAALDGLLKGVRDAVSETAPVKAEIALDLPGEVVLRGTYAVKFGPYPAGTEDVLITKTEDGYAMMGHSKPQGGPQAPFVSTCRVGPDFVFRSGTYRQLTGKPVEAAYVLERGVLKGTAARGGEALEPVSVEVAPEDAVGAPSYASDFFALNRLKMEVGEVREMQSASFGYPDWTPQKAPLKVARQEDADLARPGGATVKARFYKQTMVVENMTFNSDTWTDERGIVLKSVMTMPFGQLTVELQP